MMRFSYLLNQLINTNVNVNWESVQFKYERIQMLMWIGKAFTLSMKEYKCKCELGKCSL